MLSMGMTEWFVNMLKILICTLEMRDFFIICQCSQETEGKRHGAKSLSAVERSVRTKAEPSLSAFGNTE